MDATTRYSVGAVVPDTSMQTAIEVLYSNLISPFWAPDSIQFDQAFASKEFNDFLSLHGINPTHVPERCHKKMSLNQNKK